MTIKVLFEALSKSEYIHKCSCVDVYNVNRGSASYELLKHISVNDAINDGLTIYELIGEENLTRTIIKFK